MKNILHISDLHLSITETSGFFYENANELIESIHADLTSNHSEKIDSIFFTGDITFSGEVEEFNKANEYFIEPLLDRLSLQKDSLYFVAGNHDISRKEISIIETSCRVNSPSEFFSEMSKSINNKVEKWKRIDNFNKFKSDLLGDCTNIIYDAELITVRSAGGNNIIHCLNSAWLAGDDDDKGNLRLFNQLKFSLDKYGRGKSNIVLIHHPTDWFHLDELTNLSQEIEKRVDILIFGHMHNFEQSVTINFSQDITLRLQAGTLDSRNKNSGYSIIQLHNTNKLEFGNVKYRRYSKENKEYCNWSERGINGNHDFSIDKSLLFDSQKFSALSKNLRERIEFDHIINTGVKRENRKRLTDIYVEPHFVKESELAAIDDGINEIIGLEELRDSKNVIVISGMDQDGKTSLLKIIQSDYLARQVNNDLSQIVFYIDLKWYSFTNINKLLLQLISDYLNHDLKTSFEGKVKSAIIKGNAKILFDNLDKADKDTLKSTYGFIKKYKDNSFLITCHNSSKMDVISKLCRENIYDIYSAKIGAIARNDVRKIISLRPQLSQIISEDEVFNNVIGLINNSQLPHNHFVYSILLVIYESENDLSGILNEADIIENYIEILLRKHCMDTPANKPQYKVLVQFFGYLATSMLNKKNSQLTEKECMEVVINYENRTFNEFRFRDYFEPAIESGILQQELNGSVEFSNNCFFYYFVASHMDTDIALNEKVFSGENYLYLDKVIEYYSSKNPSSFSTLDFLGEKLLIQKEILAAQILKDQNIDVSRMNINSLDNISILDLASTNKEKFEERLLEYNIERESYDEQLDEISPLKNERKNKTSINKLGQENNYEDRDHDISFRYKNELILLSKVFRNTELLMDADKVMDIFDNIIKSYVFLMKANISRLDEDMILPIILPKINDEFLSDDISDEDKRELIQGFKMILSICRSSMPNQIEGMMSDSMASKKPRFRKILENKLASVTDSIEELLLRFMLLEVDSSNMKQHINELIVKEGKLTKSAVFFKLCQILHTRYDLSLKDKDFLKRKAAKLVKTNDLPVNFLQKNSKKAISYLTDLPNK